MLSKKMTNAINDQVNREIYSAYLYMSMSSFSSAIGLKGFANWFMVQHHEEMFHAMKMYEYLLRQGEQPKLQALKKPPDEWDTPLEMFEKTLEHEQKVTNWINELMEIAIAEKDHASQIFLQWYVTEQVEEEENDNDIIAKLNLIQKNAHGLLMLDQELSARIATVPLDYSKGVEAAAKASGE
jgi:ferritin